MDDQQREDRLKELLRDKYGEEFEVREMYITGGIEAWCYPVDNPDVIFKIETTLDMDNISADDYLQTIVEKQISEELQNLADEYLGESFVFADLPLGDTTNFTNPNASEIDYDSLRHYISSQNIEEKFFVNVFLTDKDDSSEKEYNFIQEIGKKINSDEYSEIILRMYYGDEMFIQDAKMVLDEFGWNSAESTKKKDIIDVIEGRKKIEA